MADSLKSKTLHALSWTFLEAAGFQGIRFIIGIILARLLFPAQFGLIGMLIIFTTVAQSFLDSGFGSALIQKREITPLDTCSIFYFNIVVGVLAAGLLSLAAPLIAAFYKQPALTALMRVLTLEIVINSFGLIQNVLFTKKIEFKTLTKINLIAGVLSGILGVTLAFAGFGVWSLAVQQISSALFRTVSLWIFSPWRPAWLFSFGALRQMFGFGSRLLFSDLINRIFDNIYSLVIGKLFSATDLGFFSRAKSIQDVPSTTLAGMVGRVTFPVFSTIQNDPVRLKNGMKKALTLLVFANFPIMIGLALVARPLVLVLLTEKWAPCIPYLQILCLNALLYPMQVINLNLLLALGRSDLFFRLEIVKKIALVVAIAVTWRWGIMAIIYGLMATSLLAFFINSYYTGRLIGYSVWGQIRDASSSLALAGLMGLAVYAAGQIRISSHVVMLSLQIGVGIGFYIGASLLFRIPILLEMGQLVKSRVQMMFKGVAS